jgi:hypothetical protein
MGKAITELDTADIRKIFQFGSRTRAPEEEHEEQRSDRHEEREEGHGKRRRDARVCSKPAAKRMAQREHVVQQAAEPLDDRPHQALVRPRITLKIRSGLAAAASATIASAAAASTTVARRGEGRGAAAVVAPKRPAAKKKKLPWDSGTDTSDSD